VRVQKSKELCTSKKLFESHIKCLGLSVYADGESGCGKEDPPRMNKKKLTAGDLMAAETTLAQSVYTPPHMQRGGGSLMKAKY
jgi:hypothetical protein